MFLVSPPNDACACLVLPLLLFYSQHASPLSCANLGFMTKARVATKYSNNLNICQMLPSGKLQLMINTIFFSKKKKFNIKISMLFVTRGFSQEPRFDYHETFSLT